MDRAAEAVLGGHVLAEGVGGDPAVQLLPAPPDGLQGLGEDRLEGAQLGGDEVVGPVRPVDERLRIGVVLGGVLVGVTVRADPRAAAEELLAAPVDGADGLVEDDLEVGELGVDVVVGLGADLLGLAAGLGEDPVGLLLRLPGDLGVGDDRAALGVGGLDDPLGLPAGLLDHLLAVADQLPGLGEGAGQGLAHLFEQGEQLGAVDHAGCRHGHGAGALHGRRDLVELLLHVHLVLATLYSRLEKDGTTVRAVGARPTPGDGASAVVAARHFSASRSVRRPRTSGGTRWETSPPQAATSLTREEERKLYVGLVGTKRVSTPERPLFIWAICSS